MAPPDRKSPTPHPEGWIPVHSNGAGPFVSRIVYRLPDGAQFVWTSRPHRKGHSPKSLSRSIAALFMVGSACFALPSLASLEPAWFGKTLQDATALNAVFFVGSLFFTTAAYLQLLEAANANRGAALDRGETPTEGFRWFGWLPEHIGWWSALIQFAGTIMFNFNTGDALLPGLDWLQQDLLIWAPDVLGSTCFLVSSWLAVLELTHGLWSWEPRSISWWVVVVNLLGSIAFMASAVFALVLRDTTIAMDIRVVNASTLVGAVCFLVAAYLTLPEVKRHRIQGG